MNSSNLVVVVKKDLYLAGMTLGFTELAVISLCECVCVLMSTSIGCDSAHLSQARRHGFSPSRCFDGKVSSSQVESYGEQVPFSRE